MITQAGTWLQKLMTIGVDKVTDLEIQARIRIMNASMGMALVMCIVILTTIQGQPDILILFGTGFIFLIIYFILTHLGLPQIGWYLILIFPPSAIIIGSFWFKVAPSTLAFILFCQTLSFVLFRRKKVFFVLLVFYIVLTFSGCVLMFSDVIQEDNFDSNVLKNVLVLGFCLLLQIFAVLLLQKERRESEAALRNSEAKFREFFENNPIGIIIDDTKNKRFVEVNQKVSELLRYPKKELLMQSKPKLTYPEDQNIKLIDYDKVLAGERPYVTVEKRYLGKDGSIVWAKTYIALIKDENNKPKYNIVMIQDITKAKNEENEIQRLLEELQTLNEELEAEIRSRTEDLQETYNALSRSNQDLEQFAHIASSDLREPLRTIGTFVQLLEKRYSDKIDKNGQDYINYAVDGVNRMSKLIQGLLQYAEVGKKDTQFESTNINQLVHSKLLDLDHFIKDKSAIVNIGMLPIDLECEPIQLGVVFYNLIANGIKFNEQEQPIVNVNAEELEDHWQFSVQDNGIGIPDEFKDKIFEVFKRLHSREFYEGSGIGLSVCKKIVYRHGGEIWLKSEMGNGTTFYFTIAKNLK